MSDFCVSNWARLRNVACEGQERKKVRFAGIKEWLLFDSFFFGNSCFIQLRSNQVLIRRFNGKWDFFLKEGPIYTQEKHIFLNWFEYIMTSEFQFAGGKVTP